MPSSVCASCRWINRNRLRRRLADLQSLRRSYHPSAGHYAQSQKAASFHSYYWDTLPPTTEQLSAASTFFRTHSPRKLWTATEWRRHAAEPTDTLTPEVAFLGRSNVGKSSLLNALLLSPKLNHVGAKPGKTTTMHAWGLSASDPVTGGAVKGTGGDMDVKVAVLDMPGYGHASHDDWGNEIIIYLQRRKQLRRAFLLLDSVHGVKKADQKMLDLLRSEGIPHQVIASKCDRVGGGKSIDSQVAASLQELRHFIDERRENKNRIMTVGEILAVGALGDGRKNDKVKSNDMRGVQDVQWAILRATGLDEFAMKRLGHQPTTKLVDVDLVDQERLLPVLQLDKGRTPPPIPKAPNTKSDVFARINTRATLSPAVTPGVCSQRKPPPSPNIHASSKSRTADRQVFMLPSRSNHAARSGAVPIPTAPKEDNKWRPNVGGMAELMEMSGGRKTSAGQPLTASIQISRTARNEPRFGQGKNLRTRRDQIRARFKAKL